MDSLKFLIDTDNADTNKAIHLNLLAKEYREAGNYDSAHYFGQQALLLINQLAVNTDSKDDILSRVLLNIGNTYFRQSNYSSAMEYFIKSLEIKKNLGDKKGVANLYNNIGVICRNQGKYVQALDYHLKSLAIREETRDTIGLASSFNNIGLVHWGQGNYDLAVDYYFKAIEIYESWGDKKEIANAYNNIGLIYAERANHLIKNDSGAAGINFSKALKYYSDALKIREANKDKPGIASSYNNIGLLLVNQGKYAAALEYYQKSLNLGKEIGDRAGASMTWINIGEVNNDKNDYFSAIDKCKQGLEIAEEIGSKINKRDACFCLSRAYSLKKNMDSAFHFFRLYSEMKDSIINEETVKQIQEMQVKYETGKKEKEIELLNKENQMQEKQNKMLFIIMSVGVLFLIILFLLVLSRNKIRQQGQLKTKLLLQQEKHTAAIMQTQEQERERIARDIHDGIGQKIVGVIVNFEQIENAINMLPDEKKKAFSLGINSLNETYKELRAISHQMMPGALKAAGLSAAISDLLDKTLSNTDMTYHFEGNVDDVSENISIGTYRIFQELLNNILKHAHAKNISVQLFKNQNHLILIVEDDGTGIKNKINQESVKNGIGLNNIEGRIKVMHGKFSLYDSPEKGTVASVRIPLVS